MDESGGAMLNEGRPPRMRGGLGRAWQNLLALARLDPGLAAIVGMAVIGLAVAAYLTIVHYDASLPLACPTTGHINCEAVTSSRWSVIPGTKWPITFPGMLWFAVSGWLAIRSLQSIARGESESIQVRRAQVAWGALGVLTVLYLVYTEIVTLKFTFCEWCTVVHLATFLSFVIAFDRFSRVPLVQPIRQSARAAVKPVRSQARANGNPAPNGARASGARTAPVSATRTAGAARPNGARPVASAARRPSQKTSGKR
jgi:uncharacterized membrane protein